MVGRKPFVSILDRLGAIRKWDTLSPRTDLVQTPNFTHSRHQTICPHRGRFLTNFWKISSFSLATIPQFGPATKDSIRPKHKQPHISSLLYHNEQPMMSRLARVRKTANKEVYSTYSSCLSGQWPDVETTSSFFHWVHACF